MKHNILHSIVCAACTLAAVALTACSDETIAGQWVGGEQKIYLAERQMADVAVTSRYDFKPSDNDPRKGTITITADGVIRDEVLAVDSLNINYEVTIVGSATVNGTYAYEKGEDDDIDITLDFKTLKVNILPQAVTYGDDLATGQSDPEVQTLDREMVARRYAPMLRKALEEEYGKITHLSDIKIKNTIMSCEINDRDYMFRRIETQAN